MGAHQKIGVWRFVRSSTPEPSELSGQAYQTGTPRLGVFVASVLLLCTPLSVSAAPLVPPQGELLGRCADPTDLSLSDNLRGEDCPLPWSEELRSEELRKEYRDEDTTEWWERFSLGPQEFSEQELRFLYRPGERRPLWGY
jgi:hypothetical protein